MTTFFWIQSKKIMKNKNCLVWKISKQSNNTKWIVACIKYVNKRSRMKKQTELILKKKNKTNTSVLLICVGMRFRKCVRCCVFRYNDGVANNLNCAWIHREPKFKSFTVIALTCDDQKWNGINNDLPMSLFIIAYSLISFCALSSFYKTVLIDGRCFVFVHSTVSCFSIAYSQLK